MANLVPDRSERLTSCRSTSAPSPRNAVSSAKAPRESICSSSSGSLDMTHMLTVTLSCRRASAKRYERMMRAHGISTPGPSGRPVPGSSPTKGEDASPAKKRKFDKGKDAVFADVAHDDEGMAGIKSEGTNEDSAFHTNTDQDSSPTAQKRVKPADLADEEDLGSDLDCLQD